ncbi:MAG: hypothetical protein AAGD13_13860 [Pseudomonadota bacterium]
MQKVIAGTIAAAVALSAVAAAAQDNTAPAQKPTAIERLWTGLTGATSTKTKTSGSAYSASDEVLLNGYAKTGKPQLDDWIRNLRRSRGGGPNG